MRGPAPIATAAFAATAAVLCASPCTSFQPPSSLRAPLSFTDHHLPNQSREPLTQRGRSGSKSTALPALPAAIASVASPLGSVSVLAFVVLVHETGHFLAARSMGIRVEEFSVGVGPKIFGFTRTAKDESGDEIDFNLRAVPLGGYVRFPENYNTTQAMIVEDEAREARKEWIEQMKEHSEDSRDSQPRTAGLLNALTFGLAGRKELEKAERAIEEAKRLETEELKYRPWKKLFLFSKQPTKRAIAVEPPVGPPDIEYYEDPNLLQNRPWQERAIVLVGGIVFNILLAFTCYFGELTVGDGLPKPMFREGALVTQAPRANGPSYGVLHQGDVIIGINGNPLMTTRSPNVMQSQDAINEFISTIRKTSVGDSIRVSVVAGKSSSPKEVIIKPQLSANTQQTIGVMLGPNYVGTTKIQADNILDGLGKASAATSDITVATARGIFTLLGNMVMGKGSAGQAVSGPIGLIKQGSDVVSSGGGTAAVIGFATAISVNLAVVNALPLPALDGGQLVFVLAEGLTGKKVDQRKQETINSVFLFLLLAFSFSTALGDVQKLVFR